MTAEVVHIPTAPAASSPGSAADDMHVVDASSMSEVALAETSLYRELAGRMHEAHASTGRTPSTQLLGSYEEFLPDPELSSKNTPEPSRGQKVSSYLSTSLAQAEQMLCYAKTAAVEQFDGIEVQQAATPSSSGEAVRVVVPLATPGTERQSSTHAQQASQPQPAGTPCTTLPHHLVIYEPTL